MEAWEKELIYTKQFQVLQHNLKSRFQKPQTQELRKSKVFLWKHLRTASHLPEATSTQLLLTQIVANRKLLATRLSEAQSLTTTAPERKTLATNRTSPKLEGSTNLRKYQSCSVSRFSTAATSAQVLWMAMVLIISSVIHSRCYKPISLIDPSSKQPETPTPWEQSPPTKL